MSGKALGVGCYQYIGPCLKWTPNISNDFTLHLLNVVKNGQDFIMIGIFVTIDRLSLISLSLI